MGHSAYAASLVEGLCDLLERTSHLQNLVLRHVTALACPQSLAGDAANEDTMLPLWSKPARHPAYPHDRQQQQQQHSDDALQWNRVGASSAEGEEWSSEAPLGRLLYLVLTLDIFEVAQASPGTCGALLNTPCTAVDASATAAVQEWLHRYASRHHNSATHLNTDVCGSNGSEGGVGAQGVFMDALPSSYPPWPSAWWTTLEARGLACDVRVLLLRVPSMLAVLTSECGFVNDTLLKPPVADPSAARAVPLTQQRVGGTRGSDSLAGLSAISMVSASESTLPGFRASSSHLFDASVTSAVSTVASSTGVRPSYPSDCFLEVAPVVHVVGVVHQIYYENRCISSPAPWVNLLLLLPFSAVPVRREVNLSAVDARTLGAVAVIGEVVEICGHTQATRRQNMGKPGGQGRGGGEALVQECIVASWALPLLRSLPEPLWPVAGVSTEATSDFACPDVAVGFPPATVAALAGTACDPFLEHISLNHGDVWWSAGPPCHEDSPAVKTNSVLELPGWEEEYAARMALTCWEGTRLALGVKPQGSDNASLVTSALFSATLDAVVTAQLAIFSAQLREGVVLLLVDESPVSLITQMLAALDEVAPTATLELPSATLSRAQPSFLLPSYRAQRVPIASQLSQRRAAMTTTATPSLAASQNDTMRPPAVQRPLCKIRLHGASSAAAAAVAAPPPSVFAEVLKGSALTCASGRALVVQGVEALPAATLKVLQEALRTACSDVDDAEKAEFTDPSGRDCPNYSTRQTAATSGAITGAISDPPSSRNDGGRHAIQREGGQFVPYRVAHAAVCSVRHGACLAERSGLFEFAQRCDVVVRPAFDRRRQVAALQATAEPPFLQHLLRSRCGAWRQLIADVLALPTKLRASADSFNVRCSECVTPTVTEPCNRLLSAYFIAAKALCGEGTDASMMMTLVKLTVTHAQWRQRFTELCRRHRDTQASSYNASREPTSARKGLCASLSRGTALIDAVVAVGLCDATLHFFTAKTLLGGCVLRLLEKEAWSIWEAEGEEKEEAQRRERLAPTAPQLPDRIADVEEASELFRHLPLGTFPGASTEPHQLYQQVEFHTRLEDAVLWAGGGGGGGEPSRAVSAFSIQQLVQDLIDHLERVTHTVAASSEL
jgi:hypothetical protein